MNIPNFYAQYQQLHATGAVTLTGFGQIRAASKQPGAIYFRVNETPSRLRVINMSNNVQIRDSGIWLDTGEHAQLQAGTQTGAAVLAVLLDVAGRLGIDLPTTIEEDPGTGEDSTSLDTQTDNYPAPMVIPTVPVAAGAVAGYMVGKRMKKPILGALIGAVAGYMVGKRETYTDSFDFTV